ncbi:formate dehydrogenase subunit gamma [Chloroflexota bacterium]
MRQEVEKYRKSTRILHWVHLVAFCVLFLTGLVLFIPQLGIIAQDSWTRVIHRIAAAIFVIAPLIYIPMNWKSTMRGIKDAFTWGADDIGWLKAAPRYYFLGDEKGMPPQDHMNTGQKMWWFIVLVFGLVFVITGAVMWFAKTTAPPAVLQWMVFIHDIAFIVSGTMLLVHIYLGVIHPLMTESWGAIVGGKISVEYARSHHAKWYDRVSKSGQAKSQ